MHLFSSSAELVAELGTAIVDQLQDAIAKKGSASMAVSGGNSPKPLFAYLAQQSLRWEKVTITLVDERWVDENSDSSNAKLVKASLLQNKATNATFIPLYNGQKNPFVAEANVELTLQKLALPFDAVLLGMGDDGHTASFFPDAEQLQQALAPSENQLCCAIEPPVAPHQRMTLTLPTLLQSKKLFLLVTGAKKLEVLQAASEALTDTDILNQDLKHLNPAINQLPVRSVIHQDQCELEIYYTD